MINLLSSFISTVSAQVLPREEENKTEGPSLLESVEQARREWENARAYFNFVTDPDLIDMAIYAIEAAEKKYMYLLKAARTQGIRLDHPEDLKENLT